VSEQFALDQIGIDRRAIDVHERLPCPAAGLVYAARNQFFAGPWLADDKDAQVEPCGDHNIFSDFPHSLQDKK
jgi:hypothetical protein